MLFILPESRAFCTFFAPRVSKIQVVAKMHKMHTIQNKRQRKRAFAPSSLLVYRKYKSSQKYTKCTRFRIRGRESASFAPFSLLVYQKYKSLQKCTKCTRFRIRGRESAPFAPFSLFNSTNGKQNQT